MDRWIGEWMVGDKWVGRWVGRWVGGVGGVGGVGV